MRLGWDLLRAKVCDNPRFLGNLRDQSQNASLKFGFDQLIDYYRSMGPWLSHAALIISVVLGVLGVLYEFRDRKTRKITPFGMLAISLIVVSGAISLYAAMLDGRESAKRILEQSLELENANAQRLALSADLSLLQESSNEAAMAAEEQRRNLSNALDEANSRAKSLEERLLEARSQTERLLSRSAAIDFELGVFFDPEPFVSARDRADQESPWKALMPWLSELESESTAYRADREKSRIGRLCADTSAGALLCSNGGMWYTGHVGELLIDWDSPIWRGWRERYPKGTVALSDPFDQFCAFEVPHGT